jgi:hypothetical protein
VKKLTLTLSALAFATLANAQQTPPPQPPLLACGPHGDYEVLCGTRSPEDLEVAPDGKHLIVSEFVRGRTDAGFSSFDPAKKTYTKIAIANDPRKDWGDPTCPGPPGDALAPHGISLSKRTPGNVEQLYVVNHGGRESIEMFEVKQAAGALSLVWHGCVVSTKDFNDVAALASGGFYATHPTALQIPGANLFSGQPSGWVSSWMPGKGEAELPGTRQGYPNGVIATPDGRTMYFNAWTAKEVHKYDVASGKEVGMVKLDFMPDNLTWTNDRQILAAGVAGTRGDCPEGSGAPCIQGFGVAEIDPAKMTSRSVLDSRIKGSPIAGVSVALRVGKAIYIGAFQGDRIVKADAKQ